VVVYNVIVLDRKHPENSLAFVPE